MKHFQEDLCVIVQSILLGGLCKSGRIIYGNYKFDAYIYFRTRKALLLLLIWAKNLNIFKSFVLPSAFGKKWLYFVPFGIARLCFDTMVYPVSVKINIYRHDVKFFFIKMK